MKCPFCAPLTKNMARCRHAQEVVRRGGSEFDCLSPNDHQRCSWVHGALKSHALSAFEVADDLNTMPHSVQVKIQSGGLLGLQRLLGEDGLAGSIEDIHTLIERAAAHFGGVEQIPYSRLEADMVGFRLERRTARRRV
ncbi:hypothetical protein CKO25_11985 [Thiocapsa imhoffii]|uniref:Uncharacterized protein n=1 Tax=Thiocapsa imhoffii TaxID=382777 RepID=A0A9X1B9J1_9GAMM|nr:hypothetical protein [Thiocapsa imhoffii]MBK1645348.1 hypothetical protein [Thiocapsa imhoffii]